jgi:hypothetical protein
MEVEMRNDSVSALNTGLGNSAAGNAAANLSAADATGNIVAANASATAGVEPVQWAAEFCRGYGQTLLWLAVAFLVVALLLGVASSIIALYQVTRSELGADRKMLDSVLPDPGKLADALKGLIEALAKAPAWIALFIGGILLLWMAGFYAGAICVPSQGQENSGTSNPANSTRTTANTTTTKTTGTQSGTAIGNTQQPAGHTQGTVTNTQSGLDG